MLGPGARTPAGPVKMFQRHIGKTALGMAFGQVSSPPASPKQVQELLSLLKEAGHTDFRGVAGPDGTRRQAAGKFTREEVTGFMNRLQDAEVDAGSPVAVPVWQLTAREQIIRHVPAEKLAVELQRRGWTISEPQFSAVGARRRFCAHVLVHPVSVVATRGHPSTRAVSRLGSSKAQQAPMGQSVLE